MPNSKLIKQYVHEAFEEINSLSDKEFFNELERTKKNIMMSQAIPADFEKVFIDNFWDILDKDTGDV